LIIDYDNTFATSDEHYGHRNIIKYCARPFANEKEMDKVFIHNYNTTVNEDSVVFHIGDFSMMSSSRIQYFEKLAGKLRPVRGRHLILGNHDALHAHRYVEIGLFTTVHTAFWFDTPEGYSFLLAHDPAIYQAAMKHTIMICGHVHGLFRTLPGENLVNASVEQWDYKPASFSAILNVLKSEGKIK
jgi:calcineurin-like phosphoesterase family protein